MRESFLSLVNKSFTRFECIVVDDSDDLNLASVCQGLCKNDSRFRYIINNKRLALAASLKIGIALANGNLTARFDSNDLCTANRIELQKTYLEENPDIAVVGSWLQIINREGRSTHVRRYSENHADIENNFIYKNAMAHPTVMFRKDLVERQMYIYRDEYLFSEDLELWLRLLSQGVKFGNIPKCLVLYRQQTTNRSIGNWKFNARARLTLLAAPNYILKWVVILLLIIWGYLPKIFQRIIYSVIIFRKSIF